MPLNERADRPLVTILMLTYNQEKYVRDSVRGLLSQTYEPLQIIISDDCSQDRTWEIINEEVRAYRERDGTHNNIHLNRNEYNLGLAAHCALTVSMCRGELRVGAGGDDISLPNRVEVLVSAWIKNGKKAAVISHSGYTIDLSGKRIGVVRKSSLSCPLGAVMAWKTFPLLTFSKMSCPGASEDVIDAARAMMLGGELILDDKLLLYRVGSGISSVLRDQREPSLRGMTGWQKAFPQIFSDLEYLRKSLGEEKYNEFKVKFEDDRKYVDGYVRLLSADKFVDRFKAYEIVKTRNRKLKQRILIALYLLPKGVGDFCLNSGTRLKNAVRRWRN